jgi:hypothetical protein
MDSKMNERIKELSERVLAENYAIPDYSMKLYTEKFAELLIRECVTKMALEIMDEQWVDDAVKNTYKHFGVNE